MSKFLAPSETLELLENLRGAIREFATREETLNREHRNLTDAAEMRYHQQLGTAEADLAGQLQTAETSHEERLQKIQARFAGRERRLHEAHGAARKQAIERVDHEEGRRKYAVQKGTLEAQRRRDERLAANDAALAHFRSRLSDARVDLENLEASTRRAFRGMPLFQRFLRRDSPDNLDTASHETMLEEVIRLQSTATNELSRFRNLVVPKLFRSAPLWVWLVFALGLALGLTPALQRLAFHVSPFQGYAYAGGLLAFVLFLYFAAYQTGATLAANISAALLRSRKLQTLAEEKAQTFQAQEIAHIERETKERTHLLEQEWQNAIRDAKAARDAWPDHLEQKWRRARGTNEHWRAAWAESAKAGHSKALQRVREEGERKKARLAEARDLKTSELNANHLASWGQMESEWHARVDPLLQTIHRLNQDRDVEFPDWHSEHWSRWQPPADFRNLAPFGRLELDLTKYAGTVPHDPRVALPEDRLAAPLLLSFPNEGSLLFETSGPGKEAVVSALNNIIFRLLSTTPVSRLSFTIFDPVSLGQNFAAVTHLADYEENLIDGRIWTQPSQLEQRLADLNEHMEKVIQMYLRNEYESIAEFNRAAGNIAEKYHFLVVADFPASFTEVAMRRLLRIAASGARCGVYTLILWDHRHTPPPDYLADELRKSSIVIKYTGNQFVLAHPSASPSKVVLDRPPSPEHGNNFLSRVGEASRGSNRVEVPFAQVAPEDNQLWSLDTSEELRVPIGRSGANKLQYLSLGRGTRQHVLIAGKTGSGKSTLFHVIVTNLALWASPEQVEFYLVDFKKGVEFKSYATHHLPHARVVAIESDREFGLSVLQRVDEELRRRGELFRRLGVQDIAGFKKAAPDQPMPRSLLIIDEFQEFFVEEDRISQAAAMLLDRIVRQGRAFGIHVLLGSQTLGGAYTLARTTIGQMVIRIALQCNEADAYLIMDESNAAPRLLSRPGEGLYNDMAGATEGNSPFQAVWLPEEERSAALKKVETMARQGGRAYTLPVVFEGNSPADIRENHRLQELLRRESTTSGQTPVIWLGAPNSIKGPTEAAFPRRSGSNLLIVGQRDEAAVTMLGIGLITLAAQFPPGKARFVLAETTLLGSHERAFLDEVISTLPHEIIRGNPELPIGTLAAELGNAPEPTRTFVFIHGLQNFKKLRPDDEFSFGGSPDTPAAQFTKLIAEGPSHGIHIIASIDTYNNVTRFLGRKGLSEFEMRVLFQMSPSDSASLADDPKAGALGLYRALLYNEQEGRLETFRPYALPDAAWLDVVRKSLEIGSPPPSS